MGVAKKLVVAAAVVVGTGVAVPAYGALLAGRAGVASALTGTSTPWAVTVGASSRSLAPGLDANIPYTVENKGTDKQFLHGARAQLKSDGVGIFDTNTDTYVDDCLASWFHVDTNSQPFPVGGVEVDPGATVSGSVDVVFEDAPVAQNACRHIALELDVTGD